MNANFLDTNVLLYMFDTDSPSKQFTSIKLVRSAVEQGDAVISYQVVQETLNALTSKLKKIVSPSHANQIFDAVLVPLWSVQPKREIFQRGMEIHNRFRYSFYDSLIIGAALSANCEVLYSEDMQHGQVIDQLTIINPYR